MHPPSVLLLFFHPRYEDSQANKVLLEHARNVERVTIKDMYELYPLFDVDVMREKADLLKHSVIVWQHPLYWYNCPPLMKQWLDLVLEYGWAYGKGGDKLAGRQVLQVITSGGSMEAYQQQGRNRYTHREFLRSFEQTTLLCQMQYLPPFIVPGVNRMSPDQLDAYGLQYANILSALARGDAGYVASDARHYINEIYTV